MKIFYKFIFLSVLSLLFLKPTFAQPSSALEAGQYQLQDFRHKLKDIMAVNSTLARSTNPANRSAQMTNFLIEGNFLTEFEVILVEWLEGDRYIKQQIRAGDFGALLQKKLERNTQYTYKMRILAVDIFQLTQLKASAGRSYAIGNIWHHEVGDDGCLELADKRASTVPLRTDTDRMNLSTQVGKTFLSNLKIEMREAPTHDNQHTRGTDASAQRAANGGTKVVHTVQKGETLYSIARQHQVGVSALKAQNQLASNTIYPGQVLFIKEVLGTNSGSSQRRQAGDAASTFTAQVTDNTHHIVLQGDDMFSVANKYNITILQLMDWNPDVTFPLQAGNQVKVR